MALIKQEPTEAPVNATVAASDLPFDVDDETIVAEVPAQAEPQAQPQSTALAQPTGTTALANPASGGNVLNALSEQGYEGLTLDWTSFPIISLKNEGWFEDTERRKYGNEFKAKILRTQTRWVYRATPVEDNRKDLAFSDDRIHSSNGILIDDLVKNWQGLGKVVQEREYIHALIEMVAPGTDLDGELRIAQISPQSKGRLTGAMMKAAAKAGNPAEVVIRFYVGEKIEKAKNPFYPWAFDIAKD